MSSDNPKSMYCTELDLAEDEFFAEFEEKDRKPSDIDITKAPCSAKSLNTLVSIYNPFGGVMPRMYALPLATLTITLKTS